MGWTDDADTEGLIEENFLVALVAGALMVAVAAVLYFVGFSYDPGWFEGQNIVSSMGIIFLIVFIPAIAISTLTGKSDLVKWEALFLLISVGLVLIGNGYDFSKLMQSFNSQISALKGMQVNQLLMLILIMAGIATAVAIGTGHNVSSGAILLILALIAAIGIINWFNSGTFANIGQYIKEHGFWFAAGKALSDFTGGLAAGSAGWFIGVGCLAIGIMFVIIPGWQTWVGIILIIIGTGITGTTLSHAIWGLPFMIRFPESINPIQQENNMEKR